MAYKPFKMKGHTLPGINQKLDDHPKNVAEQGLSGSSAFQYKETSPAKQKLGTWPAEGTKPRKVTPEQKEADKETIKKFLITL